MIIARFGDTWSTAHEFGTIEAEDNWSTRREPVQQQVGGASGVYDFFGSEDYPVQPLTVAKRYTITSSTYAGVETTDLETLRGDLYNGISKLWGEMRDGTRRWAWAKCVGLKTNEKSKTAKTAAEVELEFFIPEGVWYSETANTVNKTADDAFNVTNAGNFPALVYAELTPSSVKVTKFFWAVVSPLISTATTFTWEDTGTGIPSGDTLIIDSAAYSITMAGLDSYRYVTLGTGQVAWLYLAPGTNNVTIIVTQALGSWSLDFQWYDTWVM